MLVFVESTRLTASLCIRSSRDRVKASSSFSSRAVQWPGDREDYYDWKILCYTCPPDSRLFLNGRHRHRQHHCLRWIRLRSRNWAVSVWCAIDQLQDSSPLTESCDTEHLPAVVQSDAHLLFVLEIASIVFSGEMYVTACRSFHMNDFPIPTFQARQTLACRSTSSRVVRTVRDTFGFATIEYSMLLNKLMPGHPTFFADADLPSEATRLA